MVASARRDNEMTIMRDGFAAKFFVASEQTLFVDQPSARGWKRSISRCQAAFPDVI